MSAVTLSFHLSLHTQGDQPHCGFPENNYHANAERLARAGHRVVVIEQTETPEQLKARNAGLKGTGQKQVRHTTAEQWNSSFCWEG